MARYEVNVRVSGPLMRGLAGPALDAWARATGEELASQAQAEIRRRALLFHRSRRGRHPSHPFRVNTGAAARAVRVTQIGGYGVGQPGSAWKVTGESSEGTVWWPWLEGTSRRNVGNRFRGYHTFRIVKNIIQRRARKIGNEILQRYLPAMGGD